MIGANISPGNPCVACAWEWWQYEIDARMQLFAKAAAERGRAGAFGVYTNDMPNSEGTGAALSLLSDRGEFRLVACVRPDWLTVEVLRWEDTPRLWQFNESVALGERNLYTKLDTTLYRLVNRLAFEADGLRCFARVGWAIRAGGMTVGLKIDALRPFGVDNGS